ncbi:hypothetical protein F5Y00DRAFT_256016 [Daldinia vernicosa]|uniref:uncharacterized protein n=1 Tax=Daldinia vernicosa TaxID=114800 RepID=UPI002008D751|nr:uncharacterized protein F5Y00DRAFT_256016 [Daldinia vernicosa]KAI0844414.1 hypothetical protein F5Y00DRAFT_256016 [Daldinia vernicosa]
MWASLNLGLLKESSMSLFLKSQFCTKVQWPPKNINLEGNVAIVTGSASGLGLEASRQLLEFGLSELIVAIRSIEKGEGVASELRAQFPEANIRVWPLEMESYDSIRALVCRAHSELPRLDIAILNAGMQTAELDIVPMTGHERLVQVNFLSTMLLAILLLPILKAKSSPGQPGRLTIVNSGTARGAKISEPQGTTVLSALDDTSRPWNPIERYAVSKLLGHLFIVNLVRYVNADHVIVNLVDPGLVKNTALQSFAPPIVAAFFYYYKAVLGRSVPVGASTYVDATVVKGKESHGCLVANWKTSSFAAFVYTSAGEMIRDQLWKDTMKEFQFAGVQEILHELRR